MTPFFHSFNNSFIFLWQNIHSKKYSFFSGKCYSYSKYHSFKRMLFCSFKKIIHFFEKLRIEQGYPPPCICLRGPWTRLIHCVRSWLEIYASPAPYQNHKSWHNLDGMMLVRFSSMLKIILMKSLLLLYTFDSNLIIQFVLILFKPD